MQSRGSVSAFEIYLRTGRRVRAGVEVKFNPWHDPEDGRFTFAGQGRYFGRAGEHLRSRSRGAGAIQDRSGSSPPDGRGGPREWDRNAKAGRTAATSPYGPNDPSNPGNYSTYVVQRGDTLTKIAAMRRGVTVAGLAELNGIAVDKPLAIGQRLKLQNQDYLDRAREGMRRNFALDYYMRTHGGRVPPDVAHPPSLESQILDSNWRRETRGPYDFQLDVISRPRLLYGLATPTSSPKRSRRNQKRAGGPDRRPTDDGGHYIAPRLSGPTDLFNHFAQDSNFNRGVYRVLESGWYKDILAGHKVFLQIVPHYVGTSQRPDSLDVKWYVDGKKHERTFANEPEGKPRVK